MPYKFLFLHVCCLPWVRVARLWISLFYNGYRVVKTYFRVLHFLRPFAGLFALAVLFNAIFSVLSTVTITLIYPIIEMLFAAQAGKEVMPAASAIDAAGVSSWKDTFFGFIREQIVLPDQHETLLRLSVLIIGVFVLKNIVKYISANINVRLEEGVVKSIRDQLFDKMVSLSMDYYTRNKTGGLISLITNDVGIVNGSITPTFMTLIRQPMEIALYLMILITLSPYLTLIAFSTSIVSLVLIQVATRYLRRYASRMQNAMADYTAVLQETISGIRVIKAFNAEQSAVQRFIDQTRFYVLSAFKYQRIIALVPGINEVFAIGALAAVLFVGGQEVFAGRMDGSELMLFLFSLFAIMSPISSLVGIPSQIQRGIVAAERVFAVLDMQPSVQPGAELSGGFHRALDVRDLAFAYQEKDVLRNVSFHLPKGKKVALVGQSGSGKSTMVDLVVRFYDPQKGGIYLDGKDIRALTVESYRNLFGIVSQEPTLFNDTVSNNIRTGFEQATQQDIENAARIANAHEFIAQLPQGYDTMLGDRGVLLSGGQRQRIAIARALLRNPDILIFDEATSALDSESEKLVQSAITRVLENRTAIIIAHRLSTIIDADEILVFRDGEIVERGNHAELVQLNGVYKKLYDIQYGMGEVAA